ncbi:MAG TPA: glycosyltransferase family 9 protein [Candidatus Saccharimonadales bacterium]|nr:glycosyltransferase family 9 protein [Candidatus Saccharimonadales bacterium]
MGENRVVENVKLNPSVLIVRLGAMGDILHALPAVAMLRRSLPEARIGWVVERRWRELLCAPEIPLAGSRGVGRPLVDEVHLVDTRAWRKQVLASNTRREFLSAIGELRAREYRAALDMQGAIKSATVAELSGAKTVFGFRKPRERVARVFYNTLVDGRAEHVIERNVEVVQTWLEEIGLSRVTSTLQPGAALLPRDKASEARILSTLKAMGLDRSPLAILNPGAGWGAKQWSPQRYGELAKRLASRGLRSIINYGPGEETLAVDAVAASDGKAVPLFSSLSELMGLARRSELFVGGDTGPMHLAALLGVRTVALFGPTDPARNGPYWSGTRVLRDAASRTSYSHRRTEDAGLVKITVERVMGEIEALLD